MRQLELRSTPARETWNRSPRLLTLAGVIGPMLFVLVFTVDGFFRPDYSAMRDVVSNLGVGANAWIQNLNFALCGVLLVAFAIGFSQQMRTVISRRWLIASTLLLVLAGAGVANACFFATDIPGYPTVTLHGMVHDLSFLVIFTSLMITFLLVGWQLCKTPTWRRYGWYSVISSLVTLGLLVVDFYVSDHVPQIAGLVVRILVIEAFSWYVIMGCRLLVLESAHKLN